ncbi:MAG TPA: hypothetical protein VF557_12795 [Jatrophihabitans sp.]|jgi:hypothetical protein|uniref:hypothetical protein n=1 Tax=Jatrophihabitans sp. TaxID=1932789 RepID=UPI002F18593B
MSADFVSDPPAAGLFETAEAEQAEPAAPADAEFLASLIHNEKPQASDSPQG